MFGKNLEEFVILLYLSRLFLYLTKSFRGYWFVPSLKCIHNFIRNLLIAIH